MKKNHLTAQETYALLDGLTEEQLDRVDHEVLLRPKIVVYGADRNGALSGKAANRKSRNTVRLGNAIRTFKQLFARCCSNHKPHPPRRRE